VEPDDSMCQKKRGVFFPPQSSNRIFLHLDEILIAIALPKGCVRIIIILD